MEHYVTLFDSAYLPQGIALHKSMQRWCGDFILWVLCMDDVVAESIDALGESSIRPILRVNWESAQLAGVKHERTKVEYCWTATPFSPRIVFAQDSSIERVTYVDADVWFRASPKPIFDDFEQSKKAVLITEHAYSPDLDASATSGKYCVQFMIFARSSSDPVIDLWSSQCLQWCFNRYEDGKFGDQKYLDDWPERFPNLVHVLRNKGLIQGAWNAKRYPYSDAVAYHFHGLRLLRGNRVYLGYYSLPEPHVSNVYSMYLEDLSQAVNRFPADSPYRRAQFTEMFWLFRYFKRRVRSVWITRRLRKLPGKDIGP